jgi:hypothetical protein
MKREGMIIGFFSFRLKITALWNPGRHVDVSEEPVASMDSTFILPDSGGCTVD